MEKSTKFPISINNKQCIGPCYEPDTIIIHPITLNYITNKQHPFCPTILWFNDETKKYEDGDQCLVSSKLSSIDKEQIELSYAVPTIYFNCEYFLKAYYDIYSFESAIDWISSNKNPLYTQLRVIDCAWKVFGSNADIINDQLMDFYITIIKKEWIKNLYPQIASFIYVNGNNISLKQHTDDIQEHQIERINYFFKKILTKQMIYKILQSYIEENKSSWKDIQSHNIEIEKFFANYIVNKIKNTI